MDQRTLLRKYLDDLDLVGHNLESFDQAVDDVIKFLEGREWFQSSRIENPETKQPEATYRFKFTNFRLLKPSYRNDVTARDEPLMPRECIERLMTYHGKFMTTVHVSIEGGNLPRFRENLEPVDVDLLSVPIPVGSRFCNTSDSLGALHPDVFPNRGAFIVNGGQRKNVICTEAAANNVPVFLYDAVDGYTYEIRSHSNSVRKSDLTTTVYSNVVSMKRGILMFSSRSFRLYNKGVGAVTLVNVLSNLGLTTQEAIAAALLGPEPTDELREALALTLTNTDDFPLPADVRANFGAPPPSMVSHLGRRSTGANEPPFFRTERHSSWTDSILKREILPHCGDEVDAFGSKVYVLCSMARRVALATYARTRGRTDIPTDKRDDLSNKRMDGYGQLLIELVLEAMKSIRERIYKDIRKLEKNQRPPAALTRFTFPTVSTLSWFCQDAMKTIGNGQMKRMAPRGSKASFVKVPASRKTITQSYGQINLPADIASMRYFTKTVNKQSKILDVRNVQESQFMYLCPTETQEGQEAGLKDSLSLMATTTLHGSSEAVFTCIEQFGRTRPMQHDTDPDDFVIFLNGAPVALVKYEDAAEFVDFARNARRSGYLDKFTSVTVGGPFEAGAEAQEIHLRNNAGRLTAVLLIVDDTGKLVLEHRLAFAADLESRFPSEGAGAGGRPADIQETIRSLRDFSFFDLVEPLCVHVEGEPFEFPAAAEFIDVFERRNVVVAESFGELSVEHTHAFVHPSLILSSSAAEVPFADHNQSPRNAYQCGMGKQAISGRRLTRIVSANMPPELVYPQTPLVSTEFTKALMEKSPSPTGVNAVVAIMAWDGSNQEDAVTLNKASVDRGMFVTEHRNTYTDVAKNTGLQYENGLTQADEFKFPDPAVVCQGFPSDVTYEDIDENGVIVKGSLVWDGRPLICKRRRFQSSTHDCFLNKRGIKCRCTFANVVTYYHGNEPGVVDDVKISTNAQGDTLVSVVVRYFRAPQKGDKLASRHGQKGTIGRIVPQEDLPFSMEHGIAPDIIINPHAIPSRMTVAHLLETLAGMVTCTTGEEIDATPFGDHSTKTWTVRNLAKALRDHGMGEYCEEAYMCGMTGQMIEGTCFTGPIFYQRLKHMTGDKAHARPTGKVASCTRQPVGGRASNGGKRLGVMERDCLISHGASETQKERFMFSSDPYMIHVCDVCHNPCIGNADAARMIFRCDVCGNTEPEKMSIVELPYAGKLMFQEVNAMKIGVEIVTDRALELQARVASASASASASCASAGAGGSLMEFE